MFPQRYRSQQEVSKIDLDSPVVDMKRYIELNVRAEAATLIGKVIIQEGCGLKISTTESWEDKGYVSTFSVAILVEMNKEGISMDINKIEAFRQFLMDNDLNFKEKTNGHFQIFDDRQKLQFQVWATTEKLLGTQGQSAVGIPKIQRMLTDWWAGAHMSIVGDEVATQAIPDGVTVVQKSDMRMHFEEVFNNNKGHMFDMILVTAVRLPNGATEIATNHYQVENKMVYILNAYDENMKLKTNTTIQMTGFMLV